MVSVRPITVLLQSIQTRHTMSMQMENIVYHNLSASPRMRDLVGGVESVSRAVWFGVVEDAHLSLGRLQQGSSVVIMVRETL